MMLLTSSILLPSVSASTGYDGDLGCMYSMKVQFIFDGENTDHVIWDFGDGAISEERDPIHEFPSEGVYLVKQTAVKGKGDSMKQSVAVYRVEIMGYPEIRFESNGGNPVKAIQQDAFAIPAVRPSDPVREGWTFTGWYMDKGLTKPMDWNMQVRADMTLYAGWENTDDTSGIDSERGPNNTMLALVLVVALSIISLTLMYMHRRLDT